MSPAGARVLLVVGWLVGLGAGLPAVVITLARLVDLTWWRPTVMLQAFTPLAAPAYVVVGLLLVVALLRTRRRWLLAAIALAVAGLVLHLAWAAPMVLGSTPAAARGGQRLTVMTSNIHLGGGDATDIARAVKAHDVDLLAVEEISPAALTRLEQSGALARLPYRAGGAEYGGAGTMVFSRTPITGLTRIDTTLDSWEFSVDGWRVMAVHPASPVSPDWGPELDLLTSTAARERPDLMLGDFNATLDHRPFRHLLSTGLSDSAQLTNAGWQPTWPADGYAGLPLPPGAAIDHVLVGARLTALTTSAVHIGDTDHKALVAVVATRR